MHIEVEAIRYSDPKQRKLLGVPARKWPAQASFQRRVEGMVTSSHRMLSHLLTRR